MLKRKVPIWIALPIIVSVVIFLYTADNNRAEAASMKKPKIWSSDDCLNCHKTKKILARMQDKRGDPAYCQAAFDRLSKLGETSDSKSYGKK